MDNRRAVAVFICSVVLLAVLAAAVTALVSLYTVVVF